MGAGSSKAHQSYTVAPATTSPGSVSQAPAAATPVADLESLAAEPGGDGAAAVLLVDPLDAASAVVADPLPAPATPDAAPPEAAATDPWEDAVTPVPPTAPAGEVLGVPLLVGGADLEDSLATLVAYQGSDAVHEVLYATVAEDAEAKLVEALSLSEEKLVAVVVNKSVDGRLPLDTEHQLFEQLETVAKSVNNHLKAQDEIPAHTLANYEKLAATLQELKASAPTEAEAQMLDGYLAAAESINQRLTEPQALPYAEGGKVPLI